MYEIFKKKKFVLHTQRYCIAAVAQKVHPIDRLYTIDHLTHKNIYISMSMHG